MPRHHPVALRREACSAALGGTPVKEVAEEARRLGERPLQMAAPSPHRCGPAAGDQELRGRPPRPGPSTHRRSSGRNSRSPGMWPAPSSRRSPPETQKEVPGCPTTEQPGLFRAPRLCGRGGARPLSTYDEIKFHKRPIARIRHLLLTDAIADIHARSRGTYGRLRIRAALEIEQGLIVNQKLIARIMAEASAFRACQTRRRG